MNSIQAIRTLIDENPFWLAPMAGVNDAVFRGICKRMGAGLSYTEMISATGLYHHADSIASQRLLCCAESETTIAVQLFGSDPRILAQQARVVVDRLSERTVVIDINMGCPVSKVVRKGEGSALMEDPARAREIVKRTVASLEGRNPVTVKMRRGFTSGKETAVDFALTLAQAGASALAVHGRYADQFYRGLSDRGVITRVKHAVAVPVIGSGDVMNASHALDMIAPVERGGGGADAVMVARGAQGNPWIFAQIRALRSGAEPHEPTADEIFTILLEHARGMRETFGQKSLTRMRKHASWYCRSLPGASRFRAQINALETMEDLETLVVAFRDHLSTHA